jgi:hypothetical protein
MVAVTQIAIFGAMTILVAALALDTASKRRLLALMAAASMPRSH